MKRTTSRAKSSGPAVTASRAHMATKERPQDSESDALSAASVFSAPKGRAAWRPRQQFDCIEAPGQAGAVPERGQGCAGGTQRLSLQAISANDDAPGIGFTVTRRPATPPNATASGGACAPQCELRGRVYAQHDYVLIGRRRMADLPFRASLPTFLLPFAKCTPHASPRDLRAMNETNRNMIIAVVLSMVVLFGWQFFVAGPPGAGAEAAGQTRGAAGGEQSALPPTTGTAATTTAGAQPTTVARSFADRPTAVAATPRVTIDAAALTGSINLRAPSARRPRAQRSTARRLIRRHRSSRC